ncbi:hypothetical protein CDIK_1954 [Cucumispora dikerogammari]|nr:hypothetical protein CDIK_1954 [Cucumispora dikerogammari]
MLVSFLGTIYFVSSFSGLFLSNIQGISSKDVDAFTAVFSADGNMDKVDVSYTGKDKIDYVELCKKDKSGTVQVIKGPFPFVKPKTEKPETVKATIAFNYKIKNKIEVFMKANKANGNPDDEKYSMSSMKRAGVFETVMPNSTPGATDSSGKDSSSKKDSESFFSKNKYVIIVVIITVVVIIALAFIFFLVGR